MNTVKPNIKEATSPGQEEKHCLCECVQAAMQSYLKDLDGHEANDIYELFLPEFEKPLFRVVMQYTRGNLTKASRMLGLNRATLRSRLRKYGLE